MKKLDLTKLPRKPYGKTSHIDWQASVGCLIPFVFDEVTGHLKIINHLKENYITVSYKNKEKTLRTSHLCAFKFRDLIYKNKRRLQKLDLSSIPKKNNQYDWIHSIGKTISFSWNGRKGTLLIVGYQRKNGYGYLRIQYEKQEYQIRNINLLNGKISKIISYGKYRYFIGQTLIEKKKNIMILERKKEKESNILRKKYKYHCNICGYEGWMEESLIAISTYACSHCAGKVVMKGKTDIKSEAPWMIPYFQKKDAILLNTERKNSNKKIYPICPRCGTIRKTPMQIATIYKYHSIHCPKCSDKVSYPEKFILAFFKQLNVSLIYQPKKTELPWCGHYFYDFYDPKKNTIIEVNGMHHYQEVKHYNRTLQETKVIDQKKKDLALKNNMKYLVIDCRYSELNYIKNHLLNHKELQRIYPFHEKEIDFYQCEKATMKSLSYKIYMDKKKHPTITNKELAQKYRMNRGTIGKILNKFHE